MLRLISFLSCFVFTVFSLIVPTLVSLMSCYLLFTLFSSSYMLTDFCLFTSVVVLFMLNACVLSYQCWNQCGCCNDVKQKWYIDPIEYIKNLSHKVSFETGWCTVQMPENSASAGWKSLHWFPINYRASFDANFSLNFTFIFLNPSKLQCKGNCWVNKWRQTGESYLI